MKPCVRSLFRVLSRSVVAFALGGCDQPFNSSADDGVTNAPPPTPEDFHSREINTPVIEVVSGNPDHVTTAGCEVTRFQIFNEDADLAPLGIFVQECSACHNRGGSSSLDFILDVPSLLDPPNTPGPRCDGKPYVAPGDPLNSCIVQLMMNGEEPPDAQAGMALDPEPINRPATTSESSVVYEWVARCLGGGLAVANASPN